MLKKMETEYKFLVSKEQFHDVWEQLSEVYPAGNSKVQINYYYDTHDNMLHKKNLTMRIRQEQSNLKWSLKECKRAHRALVLSDEYSGNIENLPGAVRFNDINEALYLKGCLVTERKELYFGNESRICFDISMYLGVVDYEIEIEFNDFDREKANAIVSAVGINKDIVTTKRGRFYRQLEEIENGESITSLY